MLRLLQEPRIARPKRLSLVKLTLQRYEKMRKKLSRKTKKVREQRVYHGSANDFDAFDTMNHLSEGEGNQVFGAGTYVTDQKDLGVRYANIANGNNHNAMGKVLYTVEIPDDTGKNYLDWDGELIRKQADTIRKKLYDAILALNDDYKGAEKYLAQNLRVIDAGSHIGDTYGTISDNFG